MSLQIRAGRASSAETLVCAPKPEIATPDKTPGAMTVSGCVRERLRQPASNGPRVRSGLRGPRGGLGVERGDSFGPAFICFVRILPPVPNPPISGKRLWMFARLRNTTRSRRLQGRLMLYAGCAAAYVHGCTLRSTFEIIHFCHFRVKPVARSPKRNYHRSVCLYHEQGYAI